jgi:tetratricopeptide (TPR) repeat protein
MNEAQAVNLVRFAEEAGRKLRGPDAARWRQRLDRRYSECESALRWLLDSGRADEGLRLAVALVDFWQYTDRISKGRAWLDRALLERTAEDVLRAEALFQAGLLAFWRGDDEATLALHQHSLGLARRLGEPTAIALALTGLARVELRRDIERARTLCLEALDVVDGTGDQRGRSSALHVLGVAAQMRGQFPQARGWMSQRLELAREMGDLRSVAAEAGNLSVVEQQLGDLSRARDLAVESLRIAHRLGDTWLIPYCLNSLAAIAVATPDYERAATLLSAADRMVTEQGAAWPPDEGPHFEHSRAAAAQALDPAAFERAWSAGRAFAVDQAVSYALGST